MQSFIPLQTMGSKNECDRGRKTLGAWFLFTLTTPKEKHFPFSQKSKNQGMAKNGLFLAQYTCTRTHFGCRTTNYFCLQPTEWRGVTCCQRNIWKRTDNDDSECFSLFSVFRQDSAHGGLCAWHDVQDRKRPQCRPPCTVPEGTSSRQSAPGQSVK